MKRPNTPAAPTSTTRAMRKLHSSVPNAIGSLFPLGQMGL
jgi:hypothetical protein